MNSKAKGNQAEREVASFLREHGFSAAKRGVQYAGGPNSPDVIGVPGWHLEVKRTERFKLREAVIQAEGDSRGGRWAILHRWNNGRWLTVLPTEDWLDLVRQTLPPQTISASPPATCVADTSAESQTKQVTNLRQTNRYEIT